MTISRLFLQKLGIAYLVGALPVLLGFISDVGVHGGQNITSAALWTVAAGAIGAGLRAALVLLPINLTPSDAQPVMTPPPAVKPVAHKTTTRKPPAKP